VDGKAAWMLAADVDQLAGDPPAITRLLGPFDLFLQAKDRSVLVADPARAKALWPVLGRPGAYCGRRDRRHLATTQGRREAHRPGRAVGAASTTLLDTITEEASGWPRTDRSGWPASTWPPDAVDGYVS